MKFNRRPATASDEPFVRDAYQKAYRDVVIRQFGKSDEALLDNHFSVKWEVGDFEVVEGRSGRLGAIWTTDEGDYLLLREIFLDPKFQMQGIGSELVTQELDKARHLNKPLRLRVLRENQARALYERLGFSITSETETHFWMEAV